MEGPRDREEVSLKTRRDEVREVPVPAPRAPKRGPHTFLFLGAFLLFLGGSRGYIPFIDAQVRYLVAIQIWHAGTVHPTPEQFREVKGGIFPAGKDGRPISIYGLGQSLTMLPAVAAADLASRLVPPERREEFRYLAGQFLYMTFLLPLFAALALIAFSRLLEKLGVERTAAAWGAFSLGFGTYWLFYTKTIGMELEMTGWVLWALAIHWGEDRRTLRASAASLLLGFTLLYRVEFLIPVALAAALFVAEERRRGRLSPAYLAGLFGPLVACGLAVLWHNHARTGRVLDTGYAEAFHSVKMRIFADYPGQHLFDIFLGPARGFLWFSPLFFAAALLLVPGPRRWRRSLTLGAIPVAAFTLFLSSTFNAHTVGGWGQRYMVPLVPFYLLGLTFALSPRLRSHGHRIALASFVAANALFQGVLAFDDHNGVQALTRRVQAMAVAEGREPLKGFRSNDIAGKLRNLGIPLGDDPWVARAWASPEVSSLRSSFSDNLWWLKLGRKTSSPWVDWGLRVLGAMLLLAGGGFLLRALLGKEAGREPEIRIKYRPGIPIHSETR